MPLAASMIFQAGFHPEIPRPWLGIILASSYVIPVVREKNMINPFWQKLLGDFFAFTSLHLITPHRISHTSIIITSIPRISNQPHPQKKTYKKTMWKKPAIVDCLQWLWLGDPIPGPPCVLKASGTAAWKSVVQALRSNPLCVKIVKIQFRRSFTNPPFKL